MQRLRCRRDSHLRRRSGAATVEMALAAPILLTLVFGIMQVGYAFMVQHAVQNAASKGCRAAFLPSRSTTAVTTAVNSTLQPMGLDTFATTTIQVNGSTVDVSTAASGDSVTVRVTIPLSNATLFPGFFNNWTGTLVGASANRCQ